MATLGDMKDRIADELAGRTDLLSQIEAAIRSAIQTHGARRWWFCDAILTPSLGIGVDSIALTGTNGEQVLTIDAVRVQESNWWRELPQQPMNVIEGWRNVSTNGTISDWAWFGNTLYVSPPPAAVTNFRIQAAVSPLEPATDSDAGYWMVEAEDLIRHTAAADVLANVIMNSSQAQVRATQASLAVSRLLSFRTPTALSRVSASYI